MRRANRFRLPAALGIAALGFVVPTAATAPAAEPGRPLKVLFLGDNGHHQPPARFQQIKPVLAERSIELTYTDKVSDLNAKTLADYAGLLIYANIEKISPEQERALLDYVAGGRGFIPIHCASYCFLNSPKYVELVGAQFLRHGTGTFRVGPSGEGGKHALMQGYRGFESWDETYVHTKHNEKDRIVLEYRGEGVPGAERPKRKGKAKTPEAAPPQPRDDRGEPWTWVRAHGKGRVFYTAWGHDERTWGNPGFQNLLERGIRWACGDDPGKVPAYADAPEMTPPRKDVKPFEYVEGAKIPNYVPGRNWGAQGEPISRMQTPLPADESIKHIVTPVGFEVKLFLDETMVKDPPLAKPIAMNWDERGRLWLCETLDYPNELKRDGNGRDRIRICEDTDGDGRADKFTVFADKLSIPTSLTFGYGGVIVHQAPHTLFLKDTDGDDRADVREILFTGWGTGDTHAGPSNLQYGLDNWYYGIVGYSGFEGTVAGERHSFKQGFYRFKLEAPRSHAPRGNASGDAPRPGPGQDDGKQKSSPPPAPQSGEGSRSRAERGNEGPKVSKLEFLRSTNNNSWGLGISEEGHIFGSTANGNPSVHLTIPNRYYERVRGWSASVLGGIAGNAEMHPITDKVRQVDHHGRFTAASGHAIYTARAYPQEYWNRTAFVCEPTGHLVATFVLTPSGSTFTSRNAWNLVASDDEWFAPVAAEVGPDGNVWVLDWYNYIVQHNPTPAGFRTGRGAAYETELRDKKHGRVYRVVHTASPAASAPGEKTPATKELGALTRPRSLVTLAGAAPEKLVATLKNDNMLWRRHAQRLLIERRQPDPARHEDAFLQLIALLDNKTLDAVGLDAAAIHSLWVINEVGLMSSRDTTSANTSSMTALGAMTHSSPSVRRNAVQVRPSVWHFGYWKLFSDPNPSVRLATLLATADVESETAFANALIRGVQEGIATDDRILADAVTCAGAADPGSFLRAVAAGNGREAPNALLVTITERIAEHAARAGSKLRPDQLLLAIADSHPDIATAIVTGLARGWPKDRLPKIDEGDEGLIRDIFPKLGPAARSQFLALATRWGSKSLEKHTTEIAAGFLKQVQDTKQSDEARASAAAQLIDFRKSDAATAAKLLALITPQTSPQLTAGLIEAVGRSEAAEVGGALVKTTPSLTPTARTAALRVLLSRSDWTAALVDALDQGKLQLADLSLDQKQSLAAHADQALAARAKKLLERGGGLPSADRQKVLDELMPLTKRTGDAAAGKMVFVKQCAKCHTHGSIPASLRETVIAQGVAATTSIGPDLTGMAVHPKVELLTHVIDPSRSVEGNFRSYAILTQDGRTLTGVLAAESKTSVELYDTDGKKHVVLREDIEQMQASAKSIMPEGFEKQVPAADIANLLEFLTQRGKFLPLPLEKAATIVSTRGMFFSPESQVERMVFADWSPKTFAGVPFQLVDPRGDKVPNTILLYGPQGTTAPKMPKSVSLPWGAPAKAIHLLSGVSGWGHPLGERGSVSMIVRLHYEDGKTEDHELKNGEHFADYIRRVDVPRSQFAFALRGQQLRYLAVQPKRADKIERIELVKGPDATAPIVMAVTVESRE
jgi:putative membrane-bound dehydrogenase-like protein